MLAEAAARPNYLSECIKEREINYYTMLQYQLGVIGSVEMRSEKEISKKVRAHIVHAEVPPNCQERIDATNWTILQAPFRMYSCVPESRFPAIPAKFSEFGN